MALYKFDPFKFFAGYEHIKYANPTTPLSAGFIDIGGYVLAFVTNNAYNNSKTVQVYWTGVRYTVIPQPRPDRGLLRLSSERLRHRHAGGLLDVRAQRLQRQTFEAFSFDADYRFNKHFDAYLGAMYSGVHDGVASGYLAHDQHQPHRRRALQVLIWPPGVNGHEAFSREAAAAAVTAADRCGSAAAGTWR